MAATSPATWANLAGRITCQAHAPMSLAAALQDAPRARRVQTAYDLWEKVTPAMIRAWAQATGDPDQARQIATCETCRHQRR